MDLVICGSKDFNIHELEKYIPNIIVIYHIQKISLIFGKSNKKCSIFFSIQSYTMVCVGLVLNLKFKIIIHRKKYYFFKLTY